MKLTCPKCESSFDMEQAVRELEQTETHDLAAKFGPQWRLVYEYSDCFRQSEFGAVSLTKRLRIFKDIARLFDVPTFKLRGSRYRTSWPDVIRAMTDICNAQKWGFRNHNYLLTILSKTGDRLSAEGLTAREEEEREQTRSHGARHIAQSGQPGKFDFKGIVRKVQGSEVQR